MFIEVARKFFYLQDLLGFDKASKTLDWLFNKSKIDIEKLVTGKKQSSSSSTVTVDLQSEVGFLEILNGGSDEQDKSQKKKSPPKCVEGKRKKMTRKYKSGFPANQSRAEARARAKERTQEKLRTRMLDEDSKKILDVDFCCPASPSSLTPPPSFWSAIESENDYNDRIAELISAQKISMPPPMLYCYPQNLTFSNNSSSTFTSLPDFTVVHEQQGESTSI